ncbi:hypothetical protein N0V85_005785 [Neurospora sp. IMI 360204]|nr:hypothetical protein N0V85_005785 [Neurospora sp. IMI 360204]
MAQRIVEIAEETDRRTKVPRLRQQEQHRRLTEHDWHDEYDQGQSGNGASGGGGGGVGCKKTMDMEEGK